MWGQEAERLSLIGLVPGRKKGRLGWKGGRLEAGCEEYESNEHLQCTIRPRNGAGGRRLEGLREPVFTVLKEKGTLGVKYNKMLHEIMLPGTT